METISQMQKQYSEHNTKINELVALREDVKGVTAQTRIDGMLDDRRKSKQELEVKIQKAGDDAATLEVIINGTVPRTTRTGMTDDQKATFVRQNGLSEYSKLPYQ